MTITLEPHSNTNHTSEAVVAREPIELAVGLFFQPSPVLEQARQLAAEGSDVVVTMSLVVLDQAPVTGVTRSLLEASVENRLRGVLYGAGFTSVRRRRDVAGSLVLDASS